MNRYEGMRLARARSARSLGGDALEEVQQEKAPQEAVGARQEHLLGLCGQLLCAHCIGHLQHAQDPHIERVQSVQTCWSNRLH